MLLFGLVAPQLAVHHADRQPEESLLRDRREAAIGNRRNKETDQAGGGALEKAAQRRMQGWIGGELAQAAPDMMEVGADQQQARQAHVQEHLQVRIVRVRRADGDDAIGAAHGVRPEYRAQPIAEKRIAQQVRKQRQPEAIDATGADGVEPGAESGGHTLVHRTRQYQKRRGGEHGADQKDSDVAAPEQKERVDNEKTEDGAAREREQQ